MKIPTIVALGVIISAAAVAAPINSSDVHVVDGDTIRLYDGTQPDVRLVGFNAPETGKGCKAERALGAKAAQRLEELVQAGNLDFEQVACSCPAGTDGTPKCNHKRSCGTLKSNGHDVGAILMEEDLAVPFFCGTTSCPATPRPWCGPQPPSRAKLCGNEWKSAKSDPEVRERGWPRFLSDCMKRLKENK